MNDLSVLYELGYSFLSEGLLFSLFLCLIPISFPQRTVEQNSRRFSPLPLRLNPDERGTAQSFETATGPGRDIRMNLPSD